jgi:GNAT superfamily N-acetyltransferase
MIQAIATRLLYPAREVSRLWRLRQRDEGVDDGGGGGRAQSEGAQKKNGHPAVTALSEALSPSEKLPPLQKLYFNSDYRECAVLADGSVATLRLVRPTDHDLLVDGFSRLSTKSRYLRFGGAKNRLSEKDIRYFTDVDQEMHFAICAVREDSDGNEIGIGVGRFIRLADDPTHAEPAMAVTDDAQSLGLGFLLCLRLIAAARERGVERFDANVLASNSVVFRMMKQLASDSEIHRYNSEAVVLSNLPPIDPGETWVHLHENRGAATNICT